MTEYKPSAAAPFSLFSLTWPIFIETCLYMLMGSADTFMLSRVSDNAVAAVGIANQIITITIILFNFIGLGTSVVISQYLGAKRYEEASCVSAAAVTLNFLSGILISLLIILFRQPILLMFHLSPDLLANASVYLKIVGYSLPVQALLLTTSAVLRTNGFTRHAMLISLGMNILHISMNFCFIFGMIGFPKLGVAGVAYSTNINRTLALLASIYMMFRCVKSPIFWRYFLHLKKEYVSKILHIGIPAAGENLSYDSSQMMITGFIALLGTTALATRIYTLNIMYYILLFGMSLGQGTQILVGHLIGAGRKQDAYHQLLKSLRLSFMTTIGLVSLIAVFRHSLLEIFTQDSQIIQMGSMLLLICILLEPGRTFNLVVISSLRAAGDVKFPMMMGILSMWGISVPLSYFLGIHLQMGLVGVWFSFVTDEWLRGIIMYLRWKSRAWEKKSLIGPGPDSPANLNLEPALDQSHQVASA